MDHRLPSIILAAILIASGTGCEKKQNLAEQKLAADAKWRQEQKQKAVKYYGELVKTFPESPYAKQAEERLSALGPASAAPKK